jgi:hypothetical protein
MSLNDVVSEDETTRQVKVVLLTKLVHPLVVVEDVDKLKCIIILFIIMLCYFYYY